MSEPLAPSPLPDPAREPASPPAPVSMPQPASEPRAQPHAEPTSEQASELASKPTSEPAAAPAAEPAAPPGPDLSIHTTAPAPPRPQRIGLAFLLRHPAHLIALGFGSGLSPWAPGTLGTLWAWAMFWLFDPMFGPAGWAWALGLGTAFGWWACTRSAQHLGIGDPGAIVWDEVLAFWLILWVLMPTGFWAQLTAFALFRWLDAAKPGPVGWADRRFKPRAGRPIGWREGFGILADDFVAAGCTLVLMALAQRLLAL